jgi:hypothetical protein
MAHRAADDMASDVAAGHGLAEKGWSAADIGLDQKGVCLKVTGGGTPVKMRSYNIEDRELVDAAMFAAGKRTKYREQRETAAKKVNA